MEAITLEFESNLKAKILAALSAFSSDELRIVQEDADFEKNKAILDFSYSKIQNGTAELYSFEEVNEYLNKVISEYED